MEKKLWTPTTETKYQIIIDVKTNCSVFSVITPEGEKEPSFYEVLGALHSQIMHMQLNQNIENFKMWLKEKEKLKKLETKK